MVFVLTTFLPFSFLLFRKLIINAFLSYILERRDMCLSAHVEIRLKILALKLAHNAWSWVMNRNYQTIMCACLT